ncbi:MAG: TolC family protein [Bacteriovoracaceae bacterium]
MIRYLLLILLITPVFAQDEELSVLETTIQEDPENLDTSVFNEQNSRWSTKKRDQKGEESRNLDLRSVLEEGFRRNPFQQVRGQQKEIIELQKTNLWQSFWLPKLSLSLNTGPERIDRWRTSSQDTGSNIGGPTVAPGGAVTLGFAQYTVFNWGRDYLDYQTNKQTLNRAQIALLEERRRLKFNLISQYFNMIRVKEILRVKEEQLRQTSFVHRFARERLQLRKIRAQEYYQTRSEFLRSQTEYNESMYNVGLEEEKMANTLGDEYRGSYRSVEQLKYVPVNATMEEALKLALEQSVDYRNAKLQYDNASRTYDRTLKDNLPLPKFTVDLGTWQQSVNTGGLGGSQWNYYTSSPGYRNIDLSASINATWTIFGDGGFFNSRTQQIAFLNKRIYEISYFNIKRQLEVKVRTIYKTLRYLEKKVEVATFQRKNAQKNYDSVLDNYMGGRGEYSDFKFAVDNLVLSSINEENVKYEHLQRKLELADFMGLEDFPGENFETLAAR